MPADPVDDLLGLLRLVYAVEGARGNKAIQAALARYARGIEEARRAREATTPGTPERGAADDGLRAAVHERAADSRLDLSKVTLAELVDVGRKRAGPVTSEAREPEEGWGARMLRRAEEERRRR